MGICISASELYQRAKDIINDGMDFVEIELEDPDPDDDLPAAVHFCAWKKGSEESVDYEFIDSISSQDM